MREWSKKWKAMESSTSDMKKFFPELRDFREMWKKGLWHWSTTSMVLGRLPVKSSYVGQFDEEKESDCCDCGCGQFETADHFLFECPRFEHLRLGWRWSQVSDVSKRYRWGADHLLEMRTFLTKTKRFDDGLLKLDAKKLKAEAEAELQKKADAKKKKSC